MGGLVLALFNRGSIKTKMIMIIGVLAVIFVFKVSPQKLMQFVAGGSSHPVVTQTAPAPNDKMRAYLETMKADNEDVWTKIFKRYGKQYHPAKMVIYTGKTLMANGQGLADARMGPFYLNTDKTVYIDPHFFNELSQRFGAKGDFAQAYVIAHEIGHHVQDLLGTIDKVHGQMSRLPKAEANRLSVRLELQADFYAGVFAREADQMFDFLENGDISEAIECAQAIGDDTLQREATGRVMPDSFTHGTSEQRARWFMKGYKTGRLEDGDTFSIPYSQL
jgi:predicted metalloprotease